MKYICLLTSISLLLIACEEIDPRIHAANFAYKVCIESGEPQIWCKCMREDLKTGFSKEVAYNLIAGKQHPRESLEIDGARLRCGCRLTPGRFAAYGLPCTGVKTLKF